MRYRSAHRSATVHSVNVTQKRTPTEDDARRLREGKARYDAAGQAREEFADFVAEMCATYSVREVADTIGVSTNTVQRWKKRRP